MKCIFMDHDGVLCLSHNWGGRSKKWAKFKSKNPDSTANQRNAPIEVRFDDFDKKAVRILNQILEETEAEIVISSDWKGWANLEEMGEYYISQGIIKKPIAYTPDQVKCTWHNEDPWTWSPRWYNEMSRTIEIKQFLHDHPEITHWVAVDDLSMGKTERKEWGLDNFVLTPISNEGIKQSSIKDKILKHLK